MKKLFGNIGGLKPNQIRKLENLYRRRIPVSFLISPELASDLCILSQEINRQIGLMINRQGKTTHVILGDHVRIVIPDISMYRAGPSRLKGLRCVHTHLGKEELTKDDLTDLALLRLDLVAAITIKDDGRPARIHMAHILPGHAENSPYQVLPPLTPRNLDIGCLSLFHALESELAQLAYSRFSGKETERAFLVSVTTAPKALVMDSLNELKELARSNNIEIVGTVQQQRKADPRFLLGPGKLQDLAISALQMGATLIIFDQELNPSQIRSITDRIEIKVIDRTQLILDIFARRAQSREGKIQVELAQLKYMLPRLISKNTAMSRLTGGIGGRGPGETKLELNRRRARDRITTLEKALTRVVKNRNQQKIRRDKKGLPVISIIGYTNAGKSTLLNTLTQSNVRAENRLFATLDPSSRSLKFPKNVEVIITDTVGFIKNLPKDLMAAFRATLEELEGADILLHVIDISNPRFEDQIQSVHTILNELNLHDIPVIKVLNKMDLLDNEMVKNLTRRLNGIPVSALQKASLVPLTEKIENMIESMRSENGGIAPKDPFCMSSRNNYFREGFSC